MFLFDILEGVEKPHLSDTVGGLYGAHGSSGCSLIESSPAWGKKGAREAVVLLYEMLFARAGKDHFFGGACISADHRLSTLETADAAVVDWREGGRVYAVLQREQVIV